MKHANLLAATAVVTLISGVTYAAGTLPVGTVACLTWQAAQDYATLQTTAPDFAKDLLARAACYVVKDPAEAVAQGRPEQGFQAYKLLSGHKVWLPVAR